MENYFKYLSNAHESWGLRVITCGYQQYSPGDPYPPSNHPESHLFTWEQGRKLDGCYFIYIPTGRGELETSSIKRDILPGDVIRLYPNDWHRYRPDSKVGWEEYWIGFDGPVLDKYLSDSLFQDGNSMVSNIGHHDEVIYLFNQAINLTKKRNEGFGKILAGIIFQLAAHIDLPGYQALPGPKEDYMLESVISAIKQNLKEGVDFRKMAEQVGMSYSHFRKTFKASTGYAPQYFLIRERLEYAARLLKSSDLSIQEVAEKCGFKSLFYFSRVFKEKMGASPKVFRSE